MLLERISDIWSVHRPPVPDFHVAVIITIVICDQGSDISETAGRPKSFQRKTLHLQKPQRGFEIYAHRCVLS